MSLLGDVGDRLTLEKVAAALQDVVDSMRATAGISPLMPIMKDEKDPTRLVAAVNALIAERNFKDENLPEVHLEGGDPDKRETAPTVRAVPPLYVMQGPTGVVISLCANPTEQRQAVTRSPVLVKIKSYDAGDDDYIVNLSNVDGEIYGDDIEEVVNIRENADVTKMFADDELVTMFYDSEGKPYLDPGREVWR